MGTTDAKGIKVSSKEIQKRADFNLVRYSNCWEDADILCEAIQPSDGKTVLSIASAGDNSFSILSHGAKVIAVDLSPAQLACVALRKAAFKLLSHQELLEFLGVRPCNKRWETYQRLSQDLDESFSSYWNSKRLAIESGFIHVGKFEDYFRKFREKVLPWIHSKKTIDRLLASKSLEEQARFYDSTWNTFRWRMLFKVFFSRFVMGRLGRDPEFFRYVEGSVSSRILDRTQHALTRIPTSTNPYLNYILTGNYGDALPHYLRPENFDPIRENLDGLVLFNGPIQEACEKFGGKGFDGFNLSDIFEYMDEGLTEAIYSKLISVANVGARFAYWNMLVPREVPHSLANRVHSYHELASDCLARDQAWFYSRFVVEEKRS